MALLPDWLKHPVMEPLAEINQLTAESYSLRYADTDPDFHLLHLFGVAVPEQASAPTQEATN
jgi:hypothetical protein